MTALTASVHQAPAKLDQELAALRVLSCARNRGRAFEGEAEAQVTSRRSRRVLGRATSAGTTNLPVRRSRGAGFGEVSASRRRGTKLRSQVPNPRSTGIAQLRGGTSIRAPSGTSSALPLIEFSAKIAEYARLPALWRHRTENVRLNRARTNAAVPGPVVRAEPISSGRLAAARIGLVPHCRDAIALHEHFIGNARESRCARLFWSSTSRGQVYFPGGMAFRWQETPETIGKFLTGRRISKACTAFSARFPRSSMPSSADFQIIVTEHAGSITWRGLPHVHVWELRGQDEFLIPAAWMPQE